MSQAVAPLKIPGFRALWVASIFSNIGSFLQAVAASWLMLELTGSAAWVGLMNAASTLPLLFLALVAGAVADLVDRRRLLLAAQVTMGSAAGAMAALTITGRITPTLLVGLGLLLGVGLAFNLPAWQATVPDLVPRGMIASAVALNSVAFNVARAVGPAIGGALIATAGPGAGFALNAASYLGVVAVLAVLARRMSVPDRAETSMVNAIANGVRFARYTPAFRRLLGLAAAFALTSASVQAVLPNRTTELGGGAAAYGFLLGAMGVGALVGAFTREPVTSRLGRRSVPFTVAGFGLAGVVLGLAPGVAVALGALVVAGACWVWTLANLNATAQLLSPEWVRGRSMGIYTLAFVGFLPLGSILAGVVADRLGAGGAIALSSVGAVALGLVAPRLRIPALGEVVPPEFSGREPPEHVELEGGPVMVMNTWRVRPDDLEEFLDRIQEARLIRLRTGAYRWRLYREAGDPFLLTEVFLVVSWEEHLAQHRRIDDRAAECLRDLRRFDVDGRPVTRHLVAVDLERPDHWELLVAEHARLHATDGSIPLDDAVATDGG
ncbi:MAG TPA: MFS transporter [Actinobacteria bacterium]|nr:MFS transporter [Actinomycetota bacterium]